jgi:FKBP-type peptidyl-prolyl cis-trans isomerase FkpA
MKNIIVVAALIFAACADPTNVADVAELQIIDVTLGTGTTATAGKLVTVHYTGWLYSTTAAEHKGDKFDSSRDRGAPFEFVLGTGNVIQGWHQGVAGMKVGGKRTLIIPSRLAYGASGNGPIPPDAALVFDIELLNVQ